MSGVSLNNLDCRGQQRLRDGEAERLGGFEVDDQVELGWLLDRQASCPLAFENAARKEAQLVEHIRETGPVAYQTARCTVLRIWIHRRHRMALCQRNNSRALACEERIRRDKECVS